MGELFIIEPHLSPDSNLAGGTGVPTNSEPKSEASRQEHLDRLISEAKNAEQRMHDRMARLVDLGLIEPQHTTLEPVAPEMHTFVCTTSPQEVLDSPEGPLIALRIERFLPEKTEQRTERKGFIFQTETKVNVVTQQSRYVYEDYGIPLDELLLGLDDRLDEDPSNASCLCFSPVWVKNNQPKDILPLDTVQVEIPEVILLNLVEMRKFLSAAVRLDVDKNKDKGVFEQWVKAQYAMYAQRIQAEKIAYRRNVSVQNVHELSPCVTQLYGGKISDAEDKLSLALSINATEESKKILHEAIDRMFELDSIPVVCSQIINEHMPKVDSIRPLVQQLFTASLMLPESAEEPKEGYIYVQHNEAKGEKVALRVPENGRVQMEISRKLPYGSTLRLTNLQPMNSEDVIERDVVGGHLDTNPHMIISSKEIHQTDATDKNIEPHMEVKLSYSMGINDLRHFIRKYLKGNAEIPFFYNDNPRRLKNKFELYGNAFTGIEVNIVAPAVCDDSQKKPEIIISNTHVQGINILGVSDLSSVFIINCNAEIAVEGQTEQDAAMNTPVISIAGGSGNIYLTDIQEGVLSVAENTTRDIYSG